VINMKIARLMQDGNETYGLIKDDNVATKENITSKPVFLFHWALWIFYLRDGMMK